MEVYYQHLGAIPPSHDTSKPFIKIPAYTVITNIDKVKKMFLLTHWDGQQTVKTFLDQVYAEIDPKNRLDIADIRVLCTICEDQNAQTLAADWEKKVRIAIHDILAILAVEKRHCLKKIWQETCSKLDMLKSNKLVMLHRDEADYCFNIVGPAEHIQTVVAQVEQVCSALEETLDHTSDTTDVDQHEMMVLERQNYIDKLCKKFPKLKITTTPNSITMEGLPNDMLKAQKSLNSCMRLMVNKLPNLSPVQLRTVQLLKVRELNDILAKKHLDGVVYFRDNKFYIVSPEHEVDKLEMVVNKQLVEASIEVAQEEKLAVNGTKWETFIGALQEANEGMVYLQVSPDSSLISLGTTQTRMEGVVETLKRYLQKNATHTHIIHMDPAYVKMIGQVMKDDLRKIETDFQAYSVSINPDVYGEGPGFLIKGMEDGLANVTKRLQLLTEKIIPAEYALRSPGMPYYFAQTDMARIYREDLEREYRVVIELIDDSRPKAEPFMRPSDRRGQQTTGHCQYLGEAQDSGMKVKVYVGNMTTHKVDAIVNAANGELKHIGGLAKALLDKGRFPILPYNWFSTNAIQLTH